MGSLNVGEPKNSIPFFEKSRVEELRSIAVPPFEGDHLAWHTIAADILSSTGKISVISSGKIHSVLRNSTKDLSDLKEDERRVLMARLARAVQADAVLNGVFFEKNGRYELILQIVSAKDSRILWWQAVDLNVKTGDLSPSDKKKVLSSILAPLIVHLEGKKGGQTEKKTDKNLKTLPLPDDISPM